MSDQQPPIGGIFAFDNARDALGEQLERIEALDAKAGVLLAADGVLAALLLADDSIAFKAPQVISVAVTLLLLLSILLALIAFATRKYSWAPEPETVISLIEQGDETWLKWRFLGNLVLALNINRRKLVAKARLVLAAISFLGVVILLLGGYLIHALATGSMS